MEERLENRRVIVRKVLILIGVLSLSIGLHSSGIAAIPGVASGWGQTVGLKSDGTVVAVGLNDDGQCNVEGWTGIVQVAAGARHTVGLKSNGTVVAVGECALGRCDVGTWTGIVQVDAGWFDTVGLKSDGTVVAVGSNFNGVISVDNWSEIVKVVIDDHWDHTVGLKSDGTVVAVGNNDSDQCNVTDWDLGLYGSLLHRRTCIGVFRPSSGQWYLDLDGDGKFTNIGRDGRYLFDGSGDLPVAGTFLPRPF